MKRENNSNNSNNSQNWLEDEDFYQINDLETSSNTVQTDLSKILQSWQTPNMTKKLDQNVIMAYRKYQQNQHIRSNFWRNSIQVPLPIAASITVLFLLLGCYSFMSYLSNSKVNQYVSQNLNPAISQTKVIEKTPELVENNTLTTHQNNVENTQIVFESVAKHKSSKLKYKPLISEVENSLKANNPPTYYQQNDHVLYDEKLILPTIYKTHKQSKQNLLVGIKDHIDQKLGDKTLTFVYLDPDKYEILLAPSKTNFCGNKYLLSANLEQTRYLLLPSLTTIKTPPILKLSSDSLLMK